MILIRKLAPKRLTRAIVTLAARSGNKLMRTKKDKASNADQSKEFGHAVDKLAGHLRHSKRTTITVETERLLVVQRTGSSAGWCPECDSENRTLSVDEAAAGFPAPEERDVHSSREKWKSPAPQERHVEHSAPTELREKKDCRVAIDISLRRS